MLFEFKPYLVKRNWVEPPSAKVSFTPMRLNFRETPPSSNVSAIAEPNPPIIE